MAANQVQVTAPPPPQEFSLVNSLADLNAENFDEQFPQIFEIMQPAPTPNSQMAEILEQTSDGGLVNFLCKLKTQETKGKKRRPENTTNPDGQLLSNSRFLSKGGAKANYQGQNEEEDFNLLSDRTMETLKINDQAPPTEILLDIVHSLEANPPEFKGTA